MALTSTNLTLIFGPTGKFPVVVAQLQQLRDQFGSALVVLFFFGFFWGVLKIWSGANAISKGDSEGKAGLIAGVIIASAVAIMTVLFAIFGMQDAALAPHFSL